MFNQIVYNVILLNPWIFAALAILLAFISFLILYLRSRFDGGPTPRTSNRGIIERVMWILVSFLILGCFCSNAWYFTFSLSPVKTFDEKNSGMDEILRVARYVDMKQDRLRNLPSQVFNHVRLLIAAVNSSYAVAALEKIEKSKEFIEYENELEQFKKLFGKVDEMRNFETIRAYREINQSCQSDYVWRLESYRIRKRFLLDIEPTFEPKGINTFGRYAADMKTSVRMAMNIEQGKISMHLHQLEFFMDFIGRHINDLSEVKEKKDVTRQLANDHFFAQLIMGAGSMLGIGSSLLMFWVLIQLIRHREENYLNGPLQPNMAQPEILQNMLLMCQKMSYIMPIALFIGFIILVLINRIHPSCEDPVFKTAERLLSFDGKTILTADQFFGKCVEKEGTDLYDVFGHNLMVDLLQLYSDLEDEIAADPLDTSLFKELLFQQELNNEAYRLFSEIVEKDNCTSGLSKEELARQKSLIKGIVEATDRFIAATNTLKLSKLQKNVNSAFFHAINSGVAKAVDAANEVIVSALFNCYPVGLLHQKVWRLNCQEVTVFDESLVHWIVLSYLLIGVAFMIERIGRLNFGLAEEWEVLMHNQPLYFGRHTYNTRYVTSERRTGRPEIKTNADADNDKKVIASTTTDDSTTTQSSPYTN